MSPRRTRQLASRQAIADRQREQERSFAQRFPPNPLKCAVCACGSGDNPACRVCAAVRKLRGPRAISDPYVGVLTQTYELNVHNPAQCVVLTGIAKP